MQLNINETVSVVLTKHGASIYNIYGSRYEGYSWYEAKKHKVAGDVVEAQLWHLFEIFGEHMNFGGEAPFQECNITIGEM